MRATVELTKDINRGARQRLRRGRPRRRHVGLGGNVGIQYEAIEKVLTLGLSTAAGQAQLRRERALHQRAAPYTGTLKDQPVTPAHAPEHVGLRCRRRPIPELVLDARLQLLRLAAVPGHRHQVPRIRQLNTYEAKQWQPHLELPDRGRVHAQRARPAARRHALRHDRRARPTPCCRTSPTPTASTSASAARTAAARSASTPAYQFIMFFGGRATPRSYPATYNVNAYVISLTFGFKI